MGIYKDRFGPRVFTRDVPKSLVQYMTDSVVSANEFVGQKRTFGHEWGNQDVVVSILADKGLTRHEFGMLEPLQKSALIHDIDMSYTQSHLDPTDSVFANQNELDSYIQAADRNFSKRQKTLKDHVIASVPAYAHRWNSAHSSDLGDYKLEGQSLKSVKTSAYEYAHTDGPGGENLAGDMDIAGEYNDANYQPNLPMPDNDVASDNDELQGSDLHIDHNLLVDTDMEGSAPKFSRRRKAGSVQITCGPSDSIKDCSSSLYYPFKGSRTLSNVWRHKGKTELNRRGNVTYVFRHTLREPLAAGGDQVQPYGSVLSPAQITRTIHRKVITASDSNSDGIADKNSGQLQVTTPLRDIASGYGLNRHISVSEPLRDPNKTSESLMNGLYYSPYCLQELETLSWHLNRFKVVPTPIRYYKTNSILSNDKDALPGALSSTAISDVYKALDTYASWLGSIPSISAATGTGSSSFGVFNDEPYSPALSLTQKPNSLVYPSDGLQSNVTDDRLEAGSVMRRISKLIGDGNANYSRGTTPATKDTCPKLGAYHAQLGYSRLTFTFINTGDVPLKVDMVTHAAKDGHVVGELLQTKKQAENIQHNTVQQVDILPELYSPYGSNYMAYHAKNNSRPVSQKLRAANDVVFQADTKFLPTSYRTGPKIGEHVIAHSSATGMQSDAEMDPVNGHLLVSLPGAYSTGNNNEYDFTRRYSHNQSGPVAGSYVNFVDNQRASFSVDANTQKTLILTLPKKSYNPGDSAYTGCMNDLSEAVTFSVCGVEAPVVLPGGGHFKEDGVTAAGTTYLGHQSAPTSFEIIGSEEHVVKPAFLSDEPDVLNQKAQLPPMRVNPADSTNNLANEVAAASYVGLGKRTIDGRYALLLADNEATREQREDTSKKRSRHQEEVVDAARRLQAEVANDHLATLAADATATSDGTTADPVNVDINTQSEAAISGAADFDNVYIDQDAYHWQTATGSTVNSSKLRSFTESNSLNQPSFLEDKIRAALVLDPTVDVVQTGLYYSSSSSGSSNLYDANVWLKRGVHWFLN